MARGGGGAQGKIKKVHTRITHIFFHPSDDPWSWANVHVFG